MYPALQPYKHKEMAANTINLKPGQKIYMVINQRFNFDCPNKIIKAAMPIYVLEA